MSNRVILDMDPGIDDVLALILALASPELNIAAITTANGNVSAVIGAKNIFKVYAMIGESPVPLLGTSPVSDRDKTFTNAYEVHGKDGMGNINYPDPTGELLLPDAVMVLRKVLDNSDGSIQVIATGPLTNIGSLLGSYPDSGERVKKLTFMGGTINEPGNISASAEFNMYADPENAQIVLRSNLPKTMVGLDVTRQVMLTPDVLVPDLESMKHPNGKLLAAMIRYYINFHRRVRGIEACYLHDPLAVAVAIDESIVETEEMHLEIETAGEFTKGMTIPDFMPLPGSQTNCRVCMRVDTERFFDFFITRILTFLGERWNA